MLELFSEEEYTGIAIPPDLHIEVFHVMYLVFD
jgi:hypothetical protein